MTLPGKSHVALRTDATQWRPYPRRQSSDWEPSSGNRVREQLQEISRACSCVCPKVSKPDPVSCLEVGARLRRVRGRTELATFKKCCPVSRTSHCERTPRSGAPTLGPPTRSLQRRLHRGQHLLRRQSVSRAQGLNVRRMADEFIGPA